jgi:hypothetical protein
MIFELNFMDYVLPFKGNNQVIFFQLLVLARDQKKKHFSMLEIS